MTMNDDTYGKMDDYLDGLLPENERRALEASLAVNAELRAELAALRALRDAAAALPRAIAPDRDLWLEIAAGVDASREKDPDTIVTFRRPARANRRVSTWSYLVAAAAVLVLMLGAPVMLNRGQPHSIAPAERAAVAPAPAGDEELRRVAAQYVEARNQLAALLAQRRNDIAPETLAVVEENLSTIALAVSQIETALALQPDSPKLERMLYTAYRSEVDLLRQAVELTDDSQASHEADGIEGEGDEA
jgi:hypothetical protein